MLPADANSVRREGPKFIDGHRSNGTVGVSGLDVLSCLIARCLSCYCTLFARKRTHRCALCRSAMRLTSPEPERRDLRSDNATAPTAGYWSRFG
jgi:hypothetical protein